MSLSSFLVDHSLNILWLFVHWIANSYCKFFHILLFLYKHEICDNANWNRKEIKNVYWNLRMCTKSNGLPTTWQPPSRNRLLSPVIAAAALLNIKGISPTQTTPLSPASSNEFYRGAAIHQCWQAWTEAIAVPSNVEMMCALMISIFVQLGRELGNKWLHPHDQEWL